MTTVWFVRLERDCASFVTQEPSTDDTTWTSTEICLSRESSSDGKDRLILIDKTTKKDQVPWTLSSSQSNVRYRVPYLKSVLQKSVRLGLDQVAVRVAKTILMQDADQCLRRLPVIMVEDSVVHPCLPVIVWLMAARSKGYVLQKSDVDLLLTVTSDIARSTRRDLAWYDESLTLEGNPTAKGQDVVDALLLRAKYGGTEGDMTMLRRCAGAWKARSGRSAWAGTLESLYSPKDVSVNVDTVGPLHASDLLSEGVDFHCFPRFIDDVIASVTTTVTSPIPTDFISKNNEPLTVESVRRCLWFHRSGINRKMLLCGRIDEDRPDLSGHRVDVVFREKAVQCDPLWRAIRSVVTLTAERYLTSHIQAPFVDEKEASANSNDKETARHESNTLKRKKPDSFPLEKYFPRRKSQMDDVIKKG